MTEIKIEEMSNDELKELNKSINAELRERRKLSKVSTSEIRYGLAKFLLILTTKIKSDILLRPKQFLTIIFLKHFQLMINKN